LPKRDSEFLYLTTRGWKTGRAHQIEIWFAEYDGKYYIVSEYGRRAHWIQNCAREPKVSFRVGERMTDGTARVVDGEAEPVLVGEVTARMKSKYGWDDGLILELTPVR
jgi:deazaflavin-dependent oxidoreductase (nitroreductase family)